MGGRGASSGSSIKGLTQKESSLRQRMTKLYNENSGFARTDIKSVSEAKEEWYKLKKEADKIREKRESLQKPREQTRQTQKTFVNSYGEATSREITNTTYKRQQRALEKRIRRNLGM